MGARKGTAPVPPPPPPLRESPEQIQAKIDVLEDHRNPLGFHRWNSMWSEKDRTGMGERDVSPPRTLSPDHQGLSAISRKFCKNPNPRRNNEKESLSLITNFMTNPKTTPPPPAKSGMTDGASRNLKRANARGEVTKEVLDKSEELNKRSNVFSNRASALKEHFQKDNS